MRQSLAEAIQISELQTISSSSGPLAAGISPKQIVQKTCSAILDAKGIDATIIDVSKNFGLADYFIVVSGRSDRHVQGLANKVLEQLQQAGVEPYTVDGLEQGHWVVLDLVDVVVHIFYEPLRQRYDLESLWLDAAKADLPELGKTLAERVPA